MVERVDWNFGRLRAALKQSGQEKNTAVFVFSDNGGLSKATDNRPLRAGKGSLYEGGIRVPLMIRWPNNVPAGTKCSEPVHGCDIYATIAALGGEKAAPGAVVDGMDLSPLWKGASKLERDAIYWYYPHYSPQAKQPAGAVREGAYKLIEFYDPVGVELYNLREDIGETNDLSKAMPEKTEALLDKLRAWLDAVDAVKHTLNPEH
jgi:arylsulfatase A-like enzyme